MEAPLEPVKKKRGRPRKTDLEPKRPVGRPKGENAIIEEFKNRMIASPKSRKVLDTIFDAALDHEHKNQAAAWKLLMDRMLPVSYFDKANATGGKPAVSITINGIGGETTIIGSEDDGVIDV
jgi:hypothetical protein